MRARHDGGNRCAIQTLHRRLGHRRRWKGVGAFRSKRCATGYRQQQPRTTEPEIRDYFDHFLESKPIARIDSSTTRLGCNTASRVGTWTIALTDSKTGAKSNVHARYSFVYKFDRGGWWIDHLHSSKMPEPAH